jgi:aminoglycoside phosphotransferase (APT) family kinase protein
VEDELRDLVQERLGFDVDRVTRIDGGWDSLAFDIDDEWIVRMPRRPEVRAWLRQEAALLPLLAPALPAPVPEVAVLEDKDETFLLIHRKLHGEPLTAALRSGDKASLARELGVFLAALQAFAGAAEAGLGQPTAAELVAEEEAFTIRCERVLPLLDSSARRRARALLDSHRSWTPAFDPVLVHGDLGPEHILSRDGAVTGVIDWSDARMGDPAVDFGWPLHGACERFAEALLDAYVDHGGRVDDEFRDRALSYHRLGPWHEVIFGLERDRPEYVTRGLAGVRARLP